jgi:hypothetical protein
LDFERRSKKDLQTDFNRLKEILKQRDALIENSGLVLYTDNEVKAKKAADGKPPLATTPTSSSSYANSTSSATTTPVASAASAAAASALEDLNNEIRSVLPAALVSPATAKLLDTLGEGTIDDKLKMLLSDKQELKETANRLMSEIERERARTEKLEKRLVESTSRMMDNQEASQELLDMQSMNFIFIFVSPYV